MLWEIALALWDSCIDGMYSFPPETKVNNSGGKPKVQASRTTLVCSLMYRESIMLEIGRLLVVQ